MRIAITGASGFVGSHLVRKILSEGHEVIVITRNAPKASLGLGVDCDFLSWNDTEKGPDFSQFKGIDAVINLMGANIAEKRWTSERKKELYNSRVKTGYKLCESIDKYNKDGGQIKTLVSTSAVGIYGTDREDELTEDSDIVPNDFLSRLCASWENVINDFKISGLERKVIIRTGVVLGEDGGMLEKIFPLFKANIAGVLGNGKQMLSWIHIDDLVNIYFRAINNNSMIGVYNATAPRPVSNRIFTFTLGKAMKKFTFLPAPGFALEIALGELSCMLLEGQKVIPKKLQDEQFQFKFDHIESALSSIVG